MAEATSGKDTLDERGERGKGEGEAIDFCSGVIEGGENEAGTSGTRRLVQFLLSSRGGGGEGKKNPANMHGQRLRRGRRRRRCPCGRGTGHSPRLHWARGKRRKEEGRNVSPTGGKTKRELLKRRRTISIGGRDCLLLFGRKKREGEKGEGGAIFAHLWRQEKVQFVCRAQWPSGSEFLIYQLPKKERKKKQERITRMHIGHLEGESASPSLSREWKKGVAR